VAGNPFMVIPCADLTDPFSIESGGVS
jgi:hypothetical protein